MIKIQLDDKTKKQLEKIYENDVFTSETGLYNVLKVDEVKKLLKNKYENFYNFFYNKDDGKINKKNMNNLLFADIQDMKKYIEEFKQCEYKDSNELLEKVFKYKNFSQRKIAYEISREMNVRVCPYCNRAYIFTLKNKKVRAQFDHYFPKSKYPYLSLTLFNLVPSCSGCNMAKASLDTYEKPIFYPYAEEFGEKIVFSVYETIPQYNKILSDDFEVEIKKLTELKDEENEKLNNQIESLHLKDLYNEHKDYVKDIMRNCYINSERRYEEIIEIFPNLFKSKEDFYSAIYMNYINPEDFGKRPLAKFTKNIYDSFDAKKY